MVRILRGGNRRCSSILPTLGLLAVLEEKALSDLLPKVNPLRTGCASCGSMEDIQTSCVHKLCSECSVFWIYKMVDSRAGSVWFKFCKCLLLDINVRDWTLSETFQVAAIIDKLSSKWVGMDKSKITRKQSKASKHGHENQEEYKAEARRVQSLSPFPFLTSPRAILAFLESYL
ncbi:hypothetical protein Tco_1066759 [Tanacetum coccineum]|uniref:Uncharacterized protein n=1 Tax=Tanacetum coccineum TaxID=301880 RepID=A0ABQ5HCU7_9ASTR